MMMMMMMLSYLHLGVSSFAENRKSSGIGARKD
jgi:hypothetical protein